MVGIGSKAVLLIQLLPPQIRVRSTPDSRHDGDRAEHLRFVPRTPMRGSLFTC